MFEEIFVSDNILLNFLVFINLYWYLATAIFVPAFYYIFLKIFTFPLITRKAHEFVLVISPESVKIKKIVARMTPMFAFKRNLYWFGDPCEDVDSLNRYNIYIEGLNQNIANQKKLPNKLHDIMRELELPKQIGSHKIILPKEIKKHLNRHFALIINPDNLMLKLESSTKRQPLRVSFYHTLGVYFQQMEQIQQEQIVEQEIAVDGGTVTETASGNQKMQLIQLNAQVVLKKIEYASTHRYYSSHYAFRLWKKIVKNERYFMSWVKGSIDPKIIMTLIALMGVSAGIFLVFYLFGNPQARLGPMPTG